MTTLSGWLEELDAATRNAEGAEAAIREEFARRIAALATERAHAFRRFNLMRMLADTVSAATDEEIAVAHGLAVLRNRLGWAAGSEAHDEIAERFAPVLAAAHAAHDGEDGADPASELAAFEAWYEEARGSSFWVLFETYIRETPLVDF